MASRKVKITNTVIQGLMPGDIAWDTEVAGFGARCQKKATIYFLKKRIHGVQKWFTIGKHGEPWTVIKAREKAVSYLGLIVDGKDPAQERTASKDRPTVKYLMERYLEDHAREHKKASSLRADEGSIKNHILPLLGKKFVADISDADIDRFKKDIRAGKTGKAPTGTKAVQGGAVTANRCLALLSKAFNMSIRWKWRADNPVALVAKYKEVKKERYLSQQEFAALFDAFNAEEKGGGNIFAVAALRLLAMTGARHSEILTLKWAEVDFENSRLNLPDSKTGKKSIFLSPPAKEILTRLEREKDNPYVICGTKQGAHLVNIRKTWQRVKERATIYLWQQDEALQPLIEANKELDFKSLKLLLEKDKPDLSCGLLDVRIHDLRHSFASIAAASGMSLFMIGKLLGHSQAATTQRYAHLADDPMKEASDAIGSRMERLMGGGANQANVTKLRGA